MGEVIRLDSRRPRPAGPTARRHPVPPRPVAPPAVAPPTVAPLWREVVGRRLRALRQDRAERLTDTAARAGVSPQYLSELERGRKDPSSEVLAAIVGALGSSLGEVVDLARHDLARCGSARRGGGPVLLAA